jgi:DNA-binding NarL/FixJ family response regulator
VRETGTHRVVLADDSVLLREGVARVLRDAGMEVVAQAGNADELVLSVLGHEPDVAVVDIRMPPTHTDEGIRAAEEIRERRPGTAILLLSQAIEAQRALKLVRDSPEGFGYLLKDRVLEIDDFVDAVRRVARGGSAIDPEVVAHLMGRREATPLDDLTPREREVLALMAEGRSNGAISDKLFLSPKTVETHVKSIFLKLGLLPAPDDHRRVLAVLAFLRA